MRKLETLIVRDTDGAFFKKLAVPFRIPPGWQGGTAEQYFASAEKITPQLGRRWKAARWILANKEIILNHHIPISRT